VNLNDRRLAPIMGVVSVVLFIVAIFVIESETVPDVSASGSEIADYYDGALGRLAIALVLWGLGTIALIWFLDTVREHVSVASDKLGRLLFFFGFAAALLLLASFLPDVSAAFVSDEVGGAIEGGGAQALAALGDGFFIGAELMVGGLYAMAAAAALATRVLPAWFGWLSALFAVVAFIPPIGWAVLVWGFPLWILILSALLWRQPSERVATA